MRYKTQFKRRHEVPPGTSVRQTHGNVIFLCQFRQHEHVDLLLLFTACLILRNMQLLLLLLLLGISAPVTIALRQPWKLQAPDPLGNVRLLADCLCKWPGSSLQHCMAHLCHSMQRMHVAQVLTVPPVPPAMADNKNDLGDDCIPAYCQPSVTVHVSISRVCLHGSLSW